MRFGLMAMGTHNVYVTLWKSSTQERKSGEKKWHMEGTDLHKIHTKPQSNDCNYFIEIFFDVRFNGRERESETELAHNSMCTVAIDSMAIVSLGCWLCKNHIDSVVAFLRNPFVVVQIYLLEFVCSLFIRFYFLFNFLFWLFLLVMSLFFLDFFKASFCLKRHRKRERT